LCNPASIDPRFIHVRNRIRNAVGNRLVSLFSPQHGFFAEKQDNMIESVHTVDPLLSIPVYSLYGDSRMPTAQMLEAIDTLIIDLQDVGTRVYTFFWTITYCLEAAAAHGKKVVLLDRPNPIGGSTVEGNCLSPDCRSFVGRYPIPMRHGLTVGELAAFINNCWTIDCDLTVVSMEGWRREMYFAETGLPWVAPSPNLPTPMSTLVYPGQVLWEGTNISEGRGTTQPFELFGAPFVDPEELKASIDEPFMAGVYLRPVVFEPTSNKWSGRPCRGFQIHVTDRNRYRPYLLTLKLLQSVLRLYPESFEWKPPPYEYEYERMPIDLLIGDTQLRRRLEALEDPESLSGSWQPDLEDFIHNSRKFYLYH